MPRNARNYLIYWEPIKIAISADDIAIITILPNATVNEILDCIKNNLAEIKNKRGRGNVYAIVLARNPIAIT